MAAARARISARAAGRQADEGLTLIEVVVAFTILLIALIPLSYLFTQSVIQSGQSTNQQTALSIAEQWVETLSNVTPPVNSNGEVIVNKDSAPIGPANGSATLNGGFTVPSSLATPTSFGVNVPNTLVTATTANPQTALVTNSTGTQDSITYTGQTLNGSSQITALTGVSGWSQQETFTNGAAVNQSSTVVTTESKGGTTYNLLAEYEWTSIQGAGNGAQPNLCVAGTPQLLRLRMTVSWGPNVDSNNVQDSVVIDYPPAGIQTLGFIALQVNGDSSAFDSQSNPWSTRVQAPPVQITGPQSMTIYPDQNGCAFAQVEPGTYTIAVSNASSGQPYSNDNYGSPPFVENALGTVSANELAQPQSYSATATVAVGAVARSTVFFDQGSLVSLSYPSSSSTEDGVYCPGAGALGCISTGEAGTGTGVAGTAVMTVFNQSTNVWSTVSLPAGVTRLASVACATTGGTTNRCIAVGYGSSGAVILSSPTTSALFTADTFPAGITSLSQVVCPSSTQCVAIGTTATGAAVLSGAITATSDTWTTDAISGTGTIAGLNNLVCPASSGGCIATGTSTSPSNGTPVVVAGGYGLGWTASSPNPSGVTLTSISALACPTTAVSTTCLITGTTSTAPEVVSGTATAGLGVAAPGWTWKADAFPGGTTVTSLNGLYCPLNTECLLTGRTASAPVVLYGATTPSTSVTFAADTLPAALTSISEMACPSSSACALIGATATGPAIVSGAITGPTTPDTWTAVNMSSLSVPTGYTLTQLSQVDCWSSPVCAITGIVTNNANSQPSAILLAASGATGTTSWSSANLPTTGPALYLTDIDCIPTGTTYCSAVGAGATGAVELVSNSGPTGAWGNETATGLAGLNTTGIPLELNSSNLLPSNYQTFITAGWTTTPTMPLPPLYPFLSGYSAFAGDCSTESISGLNVAQIATTPGASTSATLPLGLLSVQVLHSTGTSVGLPYGATLSLTSTASGCNADTYPLQSAGVDGLSRTEVPYGTYTLTITTAGGTTTVPNVTVGGSSVTVGGSTYTLPTPVTEKVA